MGAASGPAACAAAFSAEPVQKESARPCAWVEGTSRVQAQRVHPAGCHLYPVNSSQPCWAKGAMLVERAPHLLDTCFPPQLTHALSLSFPRPPSPCRAKGAELVERAKSAASETAGSTKEAAKEVASDELAARSVLACFGRCCRGHR